MTRSVTNLVRWAPVAALCVGAAILMNEQNTSADQDAAEKGEASAPAPSTPPGPTAQATFGGGCFWCTEAVLEQLRGVRSVASGYSGGSVLNPSYEAVCTGTTGHAEVVRVEYDPGVVSYEELLEVFFRTHDPTTLNRQGADVGTQYRSVVYYHNDEQRRVAEEVKRALDTSGAYSSPIVTEVSPLGPFYEAEPYHQDYFARNPNQGYCRAVVAPKVEKFRKVFADRLKSEE